MRFNKKIAFRLLLIRSEGLITALSVCPSLWKIFDDYANGLCGPENRQMFKKNT